MIHIFEGVSGAITPLGMLEERSKGCKSLAWRLVIYKLFPCYPNNPRGVIAPVTPSKIWFIA